MRRVCSLFRWAVHDGGAVDYQMVGRGIGRFATNASNHTPYIVHCSLAIEFRDVRPPAISLAQLDCSSHICVVYVKVQEVCSAYIACKRLRSPFVL